MVPVLLTLFFLQGTEAYNVHQPLNLIWSILNHYGETVVRTSTVTSWGAEWYPPLSVPAASLFSSRDWNQMDGHQFYPCPQSISGKKLRECDGAEDVAIAGPGVVKPPAT